jgi:hypothetical protein
MKNNKDKTVTLAKKLLLEKFTKEDALLAKWKPWLPDIKVTHRNSKKRRMLINTATLLENQANYMKKIPMGATLPTTSDLTKLVFDELAKNIPSWMKIQKDEEK